MQSRRLNSAEYAGLSSWRALLDLEWPPCRSACPVHADVRGYIELIARGRYRDALALIREVLPFPSVCGRICHHPCEQDCRRNDTDEPAAIRDLKRFVSEYPYPEPLRFTPPVQDKEKVAVIGAGPSGLTAALELARLGYKPAVFDRSKVPGGLLASAIPAYRLPREVLAKDTGAILDQGVEFKGGIEVGRDVTLDALRKQGFKAIVLAVGLSKSRALPLPGADAPRVLMTLPFLEAANGEKKPDIGQNVVVIGGGNVAVDVARTAVRLGAKAVKMVCLENEKEQPAWAWEKREALEEGISTVYRQGPKRILAGGGNVTGVEFRKVTSVFAAGKRFNPQYDESQLTTIECDTVIFAIGQEADLSLLKGSDVKVEDRGRLVHNRDTAQTSAKDVFACGEVVTGPGSAVEAVASGRRAARAADQFLRGKAIVLAEALPPKIDRLPEADRAKIARGARPKMPAVPAEARKGNFKEFELGLSEEAVIAEARRCMGCGAGAVVISDKCAACLTCRRVCPFEIPVVTEVAEIHSFLCQACGMCAAECPGNAIVMAGFAPDAIRQETGRALRSLDGAPQKLIVISCGHHAPAALWGGAPADLLPAGTAMVYIPSGARLNVADLLHAFEEGADGVLVLECASGACRYPGVGERLRKRVEQARQMLSDLRLGKDRLEMLEGVAGDAAGTAKAVTDMAARISKLGRSPVNAGR